MNCESVNLCRFIDLGDQPNGNNFPTQQEIGTEILFPFKVATDRSAKKNSIRLGS